MRTTNIDYFAIMNGIRETLLSRGIPCTMNPLYEGYQLRFHWCDGDVAIHSTTYCNNIGRVETYNFPWDEGDVSVLEPDEFIEIITNFYQDCTK